MTTFDLNVLPIHRLNGQDYPDLPGLLALTPPRRAARGREKDSLILYLMLSGNAAFSAHEIAQFNNNAANTFYQSAGTLTTAMRKAAESVNAALLERNLASTGRGQYALGLLALAAIREEKCTLLLSGPAHAVWVGEGQSRHIHDTALSGKGLGSSQNIQTYLAQVDLHTNDLLALCGKFPRDWEADLLGERPPASLEASYRKLTFTKGDLDAALIRPQLGQGIITVLHAEATAPSQSQPTPASESIEPRSREEEIEVEDILIESPQSFRDDARNERASITNYQLPITDSEPLDSAQDKSPASTLEFSNSPTPDSPASITEEELDELADFAAHMIQPSAYAIPPQPQDILPPFPKQETSAATDTPSTLRDFPPSIPRIKPVEQPIEFDPDTFEEDEEEEIVEEVNVSTGRKSSLLSGLRNTFTFSRPKAAPLTGGMGGESKPDAHAMATRQMAKVMVGGIKSGRRVNESLRSFLQRFIPRLLPGTDSAAGQQQTLIMPTYALVFIALIIPILVGTIAVVVYLRYGQSVQYDEYYSQALTARRQAASETDPIRQRLAWQNVLDLIDKAESYRKTDKSNSLRTEAQGNFDNLMGVARLEFIPAFPNGLSGATQLSRMAASESDLYMLDAERGAILHAAFTGRSLELDGTFNCQPGAYAGYEVGALVDLLALPKVNLVSATVLGIDATGNLLYCAPGQVPQAIPLPALPNTNWGRVASFVLDGGNLYVLDAASRSVWVYKGKESAFTDSPYFYFGNQIPNSIESAIDLGVSGDDLYMLHADGHLSTCTFSRIAETPTKCVDPINFQDPFPAHQDLNLFAQAHFTQLSLTAPPNTVILLLDAENQKAFRFTPRALELQNQITGHAGKGNPFQTGAVGAMAVSPNYVLYLAIGNQVYFATNLP